MQKRRQHTIDDNAPLDPVALTLAIWLGGIAAITGLVRYSDQAAQRFAADRAVAAHPVGPIAGPARPGP